MEERKKGRKEGGGEEGRQSATIVWRKSGTVVWTQWNDMYENGVTRNRGASQTWTIAGVASGRRKHYKQYHMLLSEADSIQAAVLRKKEYSQKAHFLKTCNNTHDFKNLIYCTLWPLLPLSKAWQHPLVSERLIPLHINHPYAMLFRYHKQYSLYEQSSHHKPCLQRPQWQNLFSRRSDFHSPLIVGFAIGIIHWHWASSIGSSCGGFPLSWWLHSGWFRHVDDLFVALFGVV